MQLFKFGRAEEREILQVCSVCKFWGRMPHKYLIWFNLALQACDDSVSITDWVSHWQCVNHWQCQSLTVCHSLTHTLFFCTLSSIYIKKKFRSRLFFHLQSKKHPTGRTPQIEPVPVTGQHRNIQHVKVWAWEQINIKAWNTSQVKTIKRSHEMSWPWEEILSCWLFFVVSICGVFQAVLFESGSGF